MVLYKYHGFIADSEISTDQIEGEIFTLALKIAREHNIIHQARVEPCAFSL